ncbi:hypothetical protein DFH08DRAFT_1031764 [Mycena albidolilacea]|uniref:Uncharacterized protein n=1 Tax=Mycena albidolilacea TaxID=1033008 RepID=A0AAD7AL83_9AGAR|nr:hypothetical protein DFH08DRAFT_1031764 [Mycena albidolilacea]
MQNHPYKGRAALLTLLVAAFSAESTDAAPRPRLDDVFASDVDDPSAVVLAASATPTKYHHHVPPMYSPGTDGVWRRRESYTLVGSTICDTCTATPTPTLTPSEDSIVDTVRPLGWVHDRPYNPIRTRITIALSVTLAVFIFLTILRFHLSGGWCGKRKADVEKRHHRKRRDGDVNPPQKGEEAVKPEPQTKRKWMARATARWRDNARLLARQRRFSRRAGARGSQETLVPNRDSNSNNTNNNDEEQTETHLPHPLPRRQSRHYDAAGVPRPVSPAPSLCSLASASTTMTLELAPGDDEEQPEYERAQEPEQEYEPPAYPVSPPAHASTSGAPAIAISLSPPPPHPHPPPADRKEMLSLGQLCADTDAHAEDFPPYTPRADPDSAEGYFAFTGEREGAAGAEAVAHVATDDKAVLARLAGRASAPSLRATTATATASSSSTSAYTASTDADGDAEEAGARAPEEEELFEVQLQEIRLREAGPPTPTTVPAHVWTTLPLPPSSSASSAITPPHPNPMPISTSATLPALPPPPRRRASGSEKMALERAYVHADEEVYACAYPSAPAYERRYSGEVGAEAGPSTPRASVVVGASAPPLEYEYEECGEGEDGEGASASAPPLEFWEEDEDRGEDGLPGPGLGSGDSLHSGRRSDDQDGGEGGVGLERQRERERDRHGEAHDTGWGGGGGSGSSADGGQGQGQDHDR